MRLLERAIRASPACADKKAAKQLEGVAKLVAIDCDEQKTLCGEAGIKGFPTLKWFGADKKSPKDYTGGRDAASIVTFVQQARAALAAPAATTPQRATQHKRRNVPRASRRRALPAAAGAPCGR